MVDVFLERCFDPPITVADFFALVARSGGCLSLHRVDRKLSMLDIGGRNCICWLRSIDLESVRVALRTGNIDASALWAGTVHDAPDSGKGRSARANVVVARRFETPISLEEIQAIEDQHAHCLEIRNVQFVRTFFSLDRRRMICLYEAPDAESVRQAQHEAGMPVEAVWSFQRLD